MEREGKERGDLETLNIECKTQFETKREMTRK